MYVRDFMKLELLTMPQLSKLAILLNDVSASFDMCLFVLRELDRRSGGGVKLQLAYLKRLNESGGHRAGLAAT